MDPPSFPYSLHIFNTNLKLPDWLLTTLNSISMKMWNLGPPYAYWMRHHCEYWLQKKGKLGVSQTDFVGAGVERNTDGCHFPVGTNSQTFSRSFLCKVLWSCVDAMKKTENCSQWAGSASPALWSCKSWGRVSLLITVVQGYWVSKRLKLGWASWVGLAGSDTQLQTGEWGAKLEIYQFGLWLSEA